MTTQYTFSTENELRLPCVEIRQIKIRWIHSIYKTEETHRVTVILTEDDTVRIWHPDGTCEVILPNAPAQPDHIQEMLIWLSS